MQRIAFRKLEVRWWRKGVRVPHRTGKVELPRLVLCLYEGSWVGLHRNIKGGIDSRMVWDVRELGTGLFFGMGWDRQELGRW